MHPALHEKLMEINAPLFAETSEITCGDGWYPLISGLGAAIFELQEMTMQGSFEAFEIGEEFGKLKFNFRRSWCSLYARLVAELLHEIAVQISQEICEICGRPGSIRLIPQPATRCDLHKSEAHARSSHVKEMLKEEPLFIAISRLGEIAFVCKADGELDQIVGLRFKDFDNYHFTDFEDSMEIRSISLIRPDQDPRDYLDEIGFSGLRIDAQLGLERLLRDSVADRTIPITLK